MKRQKHEWMVYDASGFYGEKTLCPSRRWALDFKVEQEFEAGDGDWRIAKVKVQMVKAKKK